MNYKIVSLPAWNLWLCSSIARKKPKMTEIGKYVAVDLGAESGRVVLGCVCGSKLAIEEVYRFSNNPIEQGQSLRWDFASLYGQVRKGIGKAVKRAGGEVLGVGVDSWGVDFGLIDRDGNLIENPFAYRDSRTSGMMEEAFALMDKREIYENTGIQFLQFNTVYQLLSMRPANSSALARAKNLLFMADLVSYCLCGRAYAEYSLASTSQLMDMRTGEWSREIFERLSLPIELMPDVISAGAPAGELDKETAKELGCKSIPIIAVGSHDTASAVAAVPAGECNWAYISSGTWSLIGVEAPDAIINDKTFEHGFTNEGGVENRIRLLKNIMGLWLVQECKRQWQKEGTDFSYSELTEMARESEPFLAYIDPDYSGFLLPGDMPARINKYLAERGERKIEDNGQMIRVILEGLAFKYRWALDKIEDIIGRAIDCVHIVGGGIHNELLCQFAADATGKRVVAGPAEATASGNILMQAKSTGQVGSLAQAREIVRNSSKLKEYRPQNQQVWEKQYEKIFGD